MGIVSGVKDFFFGEDSDDINIDLGARSDAGLRGAEDIQGFNQQGIDALAQSLGITSEQLLPFIQAGQRQLPGLETGATPEGLDQRLGKIFSSESFGRLRDKRARDIESVLSAGGLVRSGEAVDRFANLSPELGFSIEDLLTRRSQGLADRGLRGATDLGQLRAGTTGSIADLFSRTGQGFQQGRTSDANRELQRLLGEAGINLQQDELDFRKSQDTRKFAGETFDVAGNIGKRFDLF